MALRTVPVVTMPSAWLRPCAIPVLGTALFVGSLAEEAQAQNGWKWFGKSPAPATQPAPPRHGFSVSVERLMEQARQEANAGQLEQAVKTAQRAHKISEAAAGVLGTDPTCSPAMTRQFLNDMVALQGATNGLPAATLAHATPHSPPVRSLPPQGTSQVAPPRTAQPAVAAAIPSQLAPAAAPVLAKSASPRAARPYTVPAAPAAALTASRPAAAPSHPAQHSPAPVASTQPAPHKTASSAVSPAPQRPSVALRDVAAQETLPPWETSTPLVGLNEFSIMGGEATASSAHDLRDTAVLSADDIAALTASTPERESIEIATDTHFPPPADLPQEIVVDLGLPQSSFEIVGSGNPFPESRKSARSATQVPTRVEWSSKAPEVAIRLSSELDETQTDSSLPEWDAGEAAVNSFAQSATAPLLDFNEGQTTITEKGLLTTAHDDFSMTIVDLQPSQSSRPNKAALLPMDAEFSGEFSSDLSALEVVSSSAHREPTPAAVSVSPVPVSPVFVMSLSPVEEVLPHHEETPAASSILTPALSTPVASTSVASTPAVSVPPGSAPPKSPSSGSPVVAVNPVAVRGIESDVSRTIPVAPVVAPVISPQKITPQVLETAVSQPVQKTGSVPVAVKASPSADPVIPTEIAAIEMVQPATPAKAAPPVVKETKKETPLVVKATPAPLVTEITTLSAVEADKSRSVPVITPAVDRGRPGILATEEDLPVMSAPTEWKSPSTRESASPTPKARWVDPSWAPVGGATTSSDQTGKAAKPAASGSEASTPPGTAVPAGMPKTTSVRHGHEGTTVALAAQVVSQAAEQTAEISLVSATSIEAPATAPAPPVEVMDEVLAGPAVWMRDGTSKRSVAAQPQMSATRTGPMERADQQYGMSLPVAPWLAGAMGLFCLLTGYFWMRRSASHFE